MSAAVLRSQDCLKGAYHLEAFGSRPQPTARPHRRNHHRSSRAASPSHPLSPPKPHQMRPAQSSPPPSSMPQQAKPSQPATANRLRPHRKSVSPSENGPEEQTKKSLVMEQVRILKRGEDLKPSVGHQPRVGGHAAVCSMDRIDPEPQIVPRKTHSVDVDPIYAGPAFFSSPSPSSLPIPGFSLKKLNSATSKSEEAKKILLMALGLNHLR